VVMFINNSGKFSNINYWGTEFMKLVLYCLTEHMHLLLKEFRNSQNYRELVESTGNL
jgi:hypothetical protein